ncbi:MAG TPA: SRPBCC family protein [Flavobacterium sp.]
MKKPLLISVLFFVLFSGCKVASQNDTLNEIKLKNIEMKNTDYTASFTTGQSLSTSFNAIMNFRGWWSEEIEGTTDQLNETFFYHYKDVHLCKIRLVEKVTDTKLVYQVLENEFSFTKDKSEWVNTKLIFELKPEGNTTRVTFTHQGLVPEYECYEICHDAWTSYIQGSLQSLITSGKGNPNGKEGGLNAELVEKWKLPTHHLNHNQTAEKDYTTSILVDKSLADVFTAINNVRGWWQGEITGNAEHLHDEFVYKMGDVHFSKHRVIECIPNKKVVWLVTDSNLSFVEKHDEWTNTQLQFDITEEGGKTRLTFTHNGLVPAFECFQNCSGAWASLIEKSLLNFINTGKGVKVFN